MIIIAAETVDRTAGRSITRTWYSTGASHLIKTVSDGPIYGRSVEFSRPTDEDAARSIMGLAA